MKDIGGGKCKFHILNRTEGRCYLAAAEDYITMVTGQGFCICDQNTLDDTVNQVNAIGMTQLFLNQGIDHRGDVRLTPCPPGS